MDLSGGRELCNRNALLGPLDRKLLKVISSLIRCDNIIEKISWFSRETMDMREWEEICVVQVHCGTIGWQTFKSYHLKN